ncbi:TonB family protein [Wenyingzhuangia sp. chi5]|uniref:TonB family protein n=1 Tax=Wenyingzhuangia gilva TaxID=3057677 RepID=A0ABT8VTE2_9FLAO|nr:TonB family protein [Wenyingzhuangia sp. chi5]MDO3695229.1 TonB family protein [Wenyingzhuangia sp. chi5]
MNVISEKGKVIVSIEIDSLGNIKNTKIVKSNNEKLNPEALRLVKLIPNEWTPAEIGSQRKKIPSNFNFLIKFDKAIKLLYSE